MSHPPTQDQPAGGQITLRYWAAARAAAGVAEELVEVTAPVSLSTLVAAALGRYGGPDGRFAAVLGTCSVLVGDRPVATEDPAEVLVEPGATVEFLPPFAGG